MTAVLAPLRNSFDRFLQTGLRGALSAFFPLRGPATGRASFTFENLSLGEPREDAADSRDLGLTHAAPLQIVVRLVVRDGDTIVDVKEQELFFGEVPLLGDDGCFIIDGVRRHLVPRHQTLWLPSDGASTSPRERWMGPGEWLEHAFWVGLQPLRARCEKLLDADNVATRMPSDAFNTKSVSRTVRQFLTHPALCPVVDETKSQAWRRHRLCRVGPAVVLNESGGAPRSKRVDVDADADADFAIDAVSVADGAAHVSDGDVVVSGAAAAALVEERVSVFTVDVKDTPWGNEELGAIVDIGAIVNAGDVLVGLTSWLRSRRDEPFVADPDGLPRADASLRVPDGVRAARVVDVRVLRRPGLELLPCEAAAVARLGDAHLRDNDDASERRLWREQRGHELPPGVVRRVRVTLHESIALAVGDIVVDENGVGGRVSAIVDGLDAPTTKLLRQPRGQRRRKRRGAPPASGG